MKGQSDCIHDPLVESSGEVTQVENKPAADDKVSRDIWNASVFFFLEVIEISTIVSAV